VTDTPSEAQAVVRLRVEGGFGHVGLGHTRRVRTDALPAAERATLLSLLGEAGLLPGTPPTPRPAPPSAPATGPQRFTVTVESGTQVREVSLPDPVRDEPYRALVGLLRRLTRHPT
jgi:hypothetical protein